MATGQWTSVFLKLETKAAGSFNVLVGNQNEKTTKMQNLESLEETGNLIGGLKDKGMEMPIHLK